METRSKNVWTMLLVTSILSAGLLTVNGCKKSEPPPPAPTPAATTEGHEGHEHAAMTEQAAATPVAAAVEQTTCPVMGGAIDKAVFVEYQGKKVYFCCPACKPKFEAEPAKYVAKLPQFKQ